MKSTLKWLWILFVGMPRVWIGDVAWVATFWGPDGRAVSATKCRKAG
jgi:hypothetical protein